MSLIRYELQRIDIKSHKTMQNTIPIVMEAMVIVDTSTFYLECYRIKCYFNNGNYRIRLNRKIQEGRDSGWLL